MAVHIDEQRRLPWDWSDLTVPAGVEIAAGAHVDTAFSFALCRSFQEPAVTLATEVGVYSGCMFDLGPQAQVHIGEYSSLLTVTFIVDRLVSIGAYCLFSWDVVIMDSVRWARDPDTRHLETHQVAITPNRMPIDKCVDARPITIGNNVWVGFGVVIMPGVTIGDGAVIGCRSVVYDDVEPNSVAAGNPAKHIRFLEMDS